MSSDPVRLRADASGSSARVRRLFAAGVEDVPRPEELQRLASKLAPLLAVPADGVATSATLGVGAKLGLVAAVAVGLTVALVWHGGSTSSPRPAVPAATEAPSQPALAPSGSEASFPAKAPAENAPSPSAPAEGGPAAEPTHSAGTEASARPGGTSTAQARPAETEAALLERARSALSTSPARALSLCDQHRATFPSGVLAQEREVIAIEALKRLGRADAAARRAADFARRYPGSAYQKKLDASPP